MVGVLFKGVTVMPGTRMMTFLEKGDHKTAEKLLKCLNRMSEAGYEEQVTP